MADTPRVKVTCTSCKARINVPEDLRGESGKCPKCGSVNVFDAPPIPGTPPIVEAKIAPAPPPTPPPAIEAPPKPTPSAYAAPVADEPSPDTQHRPYWTFGKVALLIVLVPGLLTLGGVGLMLAVNAARKPIEQSFVQSSTEAPAPHSIESYRLGMTPAELKKVRSDVVNAELTPRSKELGMQMFTGRDKIATKEADFVFFFTGGRLVCIEAYFYSKHYDAVVLALTAKHGEPASNSLGVATWFGDESYLEVNKYGNLGTVGTATLLLNDFMAEILHMRAEDV